MKTCTQCGVRNPLADFHLCARSNDGHYSVCKPCANLRSRERYAKNRIKVSARRKQMYAENRKKAIAPFRVSYKKMDKAVLAAKKRASRRQFIMTGKTCLDCDQWKPLDDFHKNNRGLHGRTSYCKPCHRIRTTRNYEANKEAISAHQREKHLANKEAQNERVRANKASMNEQSQDYYHANKDRINAKARAKYAKNKKAINARCRELYAMRKKHEN